MAKRFNVTGLCIPKKHYMVDLTQRIEQMIRNGDYFTRLLPFSRRSGYIGFV